MPLNARIEKTWNGTVIKVYGKRAVGKTVMELGLQVESQAKALSPIDSGRLAGSITTQMKNFGTSPEAPASSGDVVQKPKVDNEAYVGTAVFYAPYVEFGTVKSDAQPFLRPALALARGETLTVLTRNGRLAFAEYLQ